MNRRPAGLSGVGEDADHARVSGNFSSERRKVMRRRFATVVCVIAVAGLGAGAALAGEVQGPPGTPGVAGSGSGNRTGAPAHSNSVCSYNGLNDMNPKQGQIIYIVQTPHNQGVPGEAGADAAGTGTPGSPRCGGGSNPENP
jgi:hypothetical protein